MKVLFYHYGNENWFGVGYLSAALKNLGHETDLLLEPPTDMYFNIPLLNMIDVKKKLLKKAVAYKPDLIAFSSTTYAFPHVRKMMAMIKSKLDVPIIIGGVHATTLPEHTLKNSSADMVCIGEGDEAIVDVVNALETGKSCDDIKNIWVKKKDGIIIKNEIRPLIEDLDKLPLPDNEIFAKYNCISSEYNIMTSRGCPFNCTYCCNNFYRQIYKDKGTYVRRKSPENVITELKDAKEKYKIKSVYFWDDVFITNKKWLLEFTDMYVREIRLPFHCLSRPENVTSETIQILKRGGCKRINIGLESGSKRVRSEILNRHMTNERIIEAARLIKEAGIDLVFFNLFGIPGETEDEMMETVNLNLKINPSGLFTFSLTPFPGLDITKYALSQGLLSEEDYEKVKLGEIAGYQAGGDSILKNPHKEIANNFKILLPIINRSPKFLRHLLIRLAVSKHLPRKTAHIIALFFVDPSRTKVKIKDFFSAVIKVLQ